MKLSINLPFLAIIRDKLRPLVRHMPVFVFVLLFGFLIFGVLAVNQILNQPSDQAYRTEQEKTSIRTRFDAQTIQKIEQLKSRQENPNLDLPSGQRINPFHE